MIDAAEWEAQPAALAPTAGETSRRATRRFLPLFRDLVLPKEHGSWSLALEPLALGLLAAPSFPGGWLSLAVIAGFFVRRPLNIAWREHRPARRAAAWRAALACGGIAAMCFGATILTAGVAWTVWLLPALTAGAIFLGFDLRGSGRAETAEIAGAAAFASLPAVFAVLAGWASGAALSLGIVMLARAVPTVLCVRAALRGAKTGEHRAVAALLAVFSAVAVVVALATIGRAPWIAATLIGVFVVRALGLLVFPRPAIRAKTLGMLEAAAGVVFVLAVGFAWSA